jgi:2-isopropylmalate synthase
MRDPKNKYRPMATEIEFPQRTWPNKKITTPPIWCSVDMRDGNQALIEPMDMQKKKRFFKMLLNIGFKQIEVGFPAASRTDYDYVRSLIESNLIPDDVTIQIMTQSRQHLIERSFEALKGVKKAIVHFYNATAPLFREVVFGVDRKGCIAIAVEAAKQIKAQASLYPETEWTFQYSPETFCFTELDFSVEICQAVIDVFCPQKNHKLIINLPTTVEFSTPNVYADQIEWFCNNIKDKDNIIISLHAHNDRGTGVASTELALMAGGQRVEGTLFGNGERTGNVDLVTLAMNMYTQGIDPGLSFSNINEIKAEVEYCNQINVHPRHPYAGDLVFTAFSGSHQDAIKKGFAANKKDQSGIWNIPYLPVDPQDLGRSYENLIRVNSQSGKGGVAYVMEKDYGFVMPLRLQIEFSKVVQEYTDDSAKEITAEKIKSIFVERYVNIDSIYKIKNYEVKEDSSQNRVELKVTLSKNDQDYSLSASGNGLLDAFVNILKSILKVDIQVLGYNEHAGNEGSDARAISYLEMKIADKNLFGVGMSTNITTSPLMAALSSINHFLEMKK